MTSSADGGTDSCGVQLSASTPPAEPTPRARPRSWPGAGRAHRRLPRDAAPARQGPTGGTPQAPGPAPSPAVRASGGCAHLPSSRPGLRLYRSWKGSVRMGVRISARSPPRCRDRPATGWGGGGRSPRERPGGGFLSGLMARGFSFGRGMPSPFPLVFPCPSRCPSPSRPALPPGAAAAAGSRGLRAARAGRGGGAQPRGPAPRAPHLGWRA